jgi:Cft2 family RNA processing exonuclease
VKLHLLGGADEVGASCYFLETADKKILVDAGIRMGAQDSLPDLDELQKLGGPDLILITHAHADHIGSLPLIHLAYPTVPLITTRPTKDLMQILLGDALKIMNIQWEKEEDIPLYPSHAVEGLLSRIQTVDIYRDIPLFDGSYCAHFTPSGHVLGACSISLETPQGNIFFAGDYSLDEQRTVAGFKPPKVRPDILITESTYGNRLHANRAKEETRLVDTVNNLVSAGGKVLIPAFALGRAQEVLLILLHAKKRGKLADVPIYADGLVRRICMVYPDHPLFVTRQLAKTIKTEGNPFFGPDKATAVLPAKRESITAGGPCIIVSSSGMLTGGPSGYYATHLAKNPKNAIFITGYQDEESPGRALLNLADQVEKNGFGKLRIANETVEVCCKVQKYGLSAHADAGQMTSVVSKLAPRHVVLVHGDEQARPAMARMLPASLAIHLPRNGETLTWKPFRKRAKSKLHKERLGEGLFQPEAFYHKLIQAGHAGARFTVQELANLWYGRASVQQTQDVEAQLLRIPRLQQDPRRPQLFRVLPPEKIATSVYKTHEATEFARETLRQDPNFTRVGKKPNIRQLVLHFDFPEKTQLPEVLKLIEETTGWSVIISDRPTSRS